MFNIDPRLRGLPATRDQVVSLFQSLNSPHLAIPGKQAGPAQAYIVALRAQGGIGVCVYLHLADVGDCAIYTSDKPVVPEAELEEQEGEAQAFVESMGFMMDNLNFIALPVAQQDELVRTLPVFMREPKPMGPTPKSPDQVKKTSANLLLGRIFASF